MLDKETMRRLEIGIGIPVNTDSSLRPIEMFAQKVERAFAPHAVAALEKLNLGAVGEAELRIEPANLRVFMRDPLVEANAVEVAALDHERAR